MRARSVCAAVLSFALVTTIPAVAGAQSVLVEAKTSAGAEVATIRTDSMRLLVPLHLLSGGLTAGYVAVGDSLRLGGEGSFVATGTHQLATTVPAPVSGAGTRMMWYPEKAAFRAGDVTGTQWDADYVGFSSVGLGHNATASGDYSTALGYSTTASGAYSTALGGSTRATNDYSTALGYSTTASGWVSTTLGYATTASGDYSAALGLGTTASGASAVALGYSTTAQAARSLVIGRYNVIAGNASAWDPADPLFVAGNGSSSSTPSNALTLYKDGNMTIAGTLTQSSDARLKEDMEPLEGTLAKVMQLTPIRYHFRPGTRRPAGAQIGLTAQQVEPLFPELVKQDGDGSLSLSYVNLSAVQEQQAEIAPLQAQVKALKARNRELESELSELLARVRKLEAGAGR
jgi:hypothetical protein